MGSRPKGLRKFPARPTSIPAPVGGWNARDSIADMPETDAVELVNWFPSPTDIRGRDGWAEHVTGLSAQIESVMAYNKPDGSSQLFCAGGGSIWDVTNSGAVTDNYLDLPGASGDYASTPDSAATSITGDIDIRVLVAADNWSTGSAQRLVAKFNTTGNQRAYYFQLLGSGALEAALSVSGTGASTTFRNSGTSIDTVVSDGEPIWLRMTADLDNGAGSYEVSFYYAVVGDYDPDTQDGTWAQLGSTATGTALAGIFDSTALLEIGSGNGGTAGLLAGKIYRAQLFNGIVGTLAADFSADDALPGASTVVSSATGETYTINGAAAIVGDSRLQVTSLTNNRWQHLNFTNSSGTAYLLCYNGADKPQYYNGSSWIAIDSGSTPSITGVTTTNLISAAVHKRRLWLVEKNSLKAWYLPVDSVGGTVNALDLSGVAQRGGYIMSINTWTLDAGYGMDDYWCAITSEGEVIVYSGVDPSSASTWSLVGVWRLAEPIGRRCSMKYGGDLLIIARNGLVAMSKALISPDNSPGLALTDKIREAVSDAIETYADNFGWEIELWPMGDMLLMNVPVQTGDLQEQYVMNILSGAWARFTGIEANTWEVMGTELYFGGEGYVGKFGGVFADNGTNINGTIRQAFSYFKSRGQLKQWKMIQPVFQSDGEPGILVGLNIDFDAGTPDGSISFNPIQAGIWDSGTWDTSTWGGGLTVTANWESVSGIGYCASLNMSTEIRNLQVHFEAANYIFEPGGLLG